MQTNCDTSLPHQAIRPRPRRAALAFLLAPLAGAPGIFCWILFSASNASLPSVFAAFLFFSLIATPVVYFFSILLGVPFYLVLHGLRGVTRNRLVIGWSVIGVVSQLIFSGGQIPRVSQGQAALILFQFAVGGAAVGLVFWWILSRDPLAPWRISDRCEEAEAEPETPGIGKED